MKLSRITMAAISLAVVTTPKSAHAQDPDRPQGSDPTLSGMASPLGAKPPGYPERLERELQAAPPSVRTVF